MSQPSEPHCRPGRKSFLSRRGVLALAAFGTLAAGVLAQNVWHPGVASAPAHVRIENPGHVAGAPVTITGSGFGVNESVTLNVRHDDGAAEIGMGHESWTVVATDGTFSTTWTVQPADAGSDFFVATAVGGFSGASDSAAFGRMAVVATDKFDYGPGEFAQIAGSGFRAGETVTLQVSHTDHAAPDGAGHDPWTVTADASGRVSASWYVDPDDSLGGSFILKARGEDSHLRARFAFIDAVCPPAPAPDPVTPSVMPGQTCPTNLNSCTAKDVVTSIVSAIPLNGDVCGSASDTLTLDFTVQFAATADQRYDLGFYISKDGLSIPGNLAQVCAGTAPQIGDGDRNADTGDCDTDLFLDLDPDGHQPNRNALDTCGDLESKAGPVRMTFRATVACDHLDINHNLLVPSCRVWEQNANHQVACTTLSQAGTGSKCDCTDLSFAGVLDPCVTAYCDDSNACTADSCTSVGGQAVCHHDNVPDQTTCNDGSACTTGDVCIAGTCTGGAPPNCDDGNVCTTDSCDPATGCTHGNNTNPCDDGDWCNGDDTCSGGTCSGHPGRCSGSQICDPEHHECHGCDHDSDCNGGFCAPDHTCKQCLNDAQCGDGNACNGVETCVANHCQDNVDPVCDDGNVCTTDACDPAVGCKHDNNTDACDDGIFCNGDDTCAGGACSDHQTGGRCGGEICDEVNHTCHQCDHDSDCGGGGHCDIDHRCKQCYNDSHCDDGNACNGAETCVANHCQDNVDPVCDDGNVCTTDACDPAVGCKHDNNTNACDDGIFCNGGDVCAGGTCTGHPSGDSCLGEICDEVHHECHECDHDSDCHGGAVCNTGDHTCVQCLTDGQCDDHNACTGVETCVANHCQDNVDPVCDDGNVCTTDACDPTVGCKHDNNTDACDDGIFCNGGDVCAGGTCTGHPSGESCLGEICDEVHHECHECDHDSDCHGGAVCNTGDHTCVQCLTDGQCDDHNACTGVETCVANHCQDNVDPVCDDGNVCTTDACDPAVGCKHDNNTNACDDGIFCNGGDVCAGGTCTGHPSGDSCLGEICDEVHHECHECDHDSDCHGGAVCNTGDHTCVQCLTDGQCDDHNACTGVETCVANHCQDNVDPVCDDGNVCTTDACDAAVGCKHDNNTDACDDGIFCNGGDVCAGGTCSGHPSGESCLGEICDEVHHECHECDHDSDCDAGAVCNTGDHTCVQCLTDGQCDDHNACTGVETCVANHCQDNVDPVCDDGNVCTTDACDPAVGCKHDNNTNACDDGIFCNGGDVCAGGTCTGHPSGDSCLGEICDEVHHECHECDHDSDCHGGAVCNTGDHTCVQCLTDGQCDDHNACNGGESCVANQCQGGTTPNCNDGNGCTDDLCNPSSGCYHTSNANSCNDGNACTTGDVCGGGSCHGGAPPSCNDNNPCTADNCSPSTGCTHTTTGDGQNGSCESVTDTEFCPLPPDSTCGAGTFRLIDLQNPTAGASGSIVQNDYLLNASNPGQWYYNVFYAGTPGSSFNLTVDIPWPFITNGANPIQVHDGTTFSGACFLPNPSLTGYVIATDAGHVSTSGNAVVLLADYKLQNVGDTQAVYVSGMVPSTGLAYITVHLDYGIKKLSGWQQNVSTLQGPDIDLNGTLDGLGDGAIFIKGGTPACTNGQDYTFDFSAGGPTIGSTIFSTNTFKKNPGVNGMITKTTGSPKTNVRVEFYGANNKLIGSTNTDADGFYMFAYKHTGKATTYTIKVPSLGLQKSVTLKANGFALANFENVP